MLHSPSTLFFFFFNDTATTEIYTLSLHDALPISGREDHGRQRAAAHPVQPGRPAAGPRPRAAHAADPGHADRKSTRLNSSHLVISYAVFCLKKKKNKHQSHRLLVMLDGMIHVSLI